MKKQFSILVMSALLIITLTITAIAQQKDNKKDNKKEQVKDKDKGNQGKVDKGQGNKDDNSKGKNDKDKDDKGNHDKKDNSRDNNDNDKGKGNNNKGKNFDYNWTAETFKDRDKIRKQDKVTICHKFNNASEPGVTIRVSSNAVDAHMGHGDVMGDCPSVTNSNYSDVFLRRRTDYYNTLYNTQDQVLYSRSILDYALARLAASRLQLETMQRNNVSQADLDRKRVVVVELEQNASLLQTLIGVTANLVANKLQN